VFLRVHDQLERHDPATPLRPWLFSFPFRLPAAYRRLARHRLTLGVVEESLPSASPTPEEELVRRQDAELVHVALEALGLETRGVFVMYEIDGFEMKESARAFEIP